MKAVVIVVEGVGAGQLGPYGSATSTTPAIDRLAARSLVLDQCFVDSYALETQLRSLWTGSHAASHAPSQSPSHAPSHAPSQSQSALWNLWRHLQQWNVPSQLITDSPVAADLASELGCPQITLVEVDSTDEPTLQTEDCALMQLFATASQILVQEETTGVVWIHSRGLRHPWDAPIDLRHAMADPEGPEPPHEVDLPELEIDDDTDPDIVVGWGQVAAAQIAVFDQAMDAIEQAVEDRDDGDEWAWLLCSLGGIPLGEHGWTRRPSQSGYSEECAAACIVRAADMPMVGLHRAEICQLPDVPMTLLDAMKLPLPDIVLWGRSALLLGAPRRSTDWPSGHAIAWTNSARTWIRTPAWSWISTSAEEYELFVKPDDRWEASDIAARRQDIAEQICELLPALRSACASGDRNAVPPLDETLLNLIR